jgi:endoglucanase
VSGSEDFESFWMHQAFVSLPKCTDLKAVVFHHAKDAERVWGNDVSTPDWRVHPDLIRGLVAWKLESDGK